MIYCLFLVGSVLAFMFSIALEANGMVISFTFILMAISIYYYKEKYYDVVKGKKNSSTYNRKNNTTYHDNNTMPQYETKSDFKFRFGPWWLVLGLELMDICREERNRR